MRAAVIVAPGGIIKAIGLMDPLRASPRDANIGDLDAWSANCMYRAYRVDIPDDIVSWGPSAIMTGKRIRLVNGVAELVDPSQRAFSIVEQGSYALSQAINPLSRYIVRRRA